MFSDRYLPKPYLILAILVIAASVAWVNVFWSVDRNNMANLPDEITVPGHSYNGYSIYADIQPTGDSVTISKVALAEAGFVLVHAEDEDKPGQVIGVSELLQPGVHENVAIDLSRSTREKENIFVTIRIDNGNGVFSSAADEAALDLYDEPLYMNFIVSSVTGPENAAPTP